MDTDSKPLLKYSEDEYTATQRGGLHRVWAKARQSTRVVTKGWANVVRVIRFREVFAEFLATFALVVSVPSGLEYCCGCIIIIFRWEVYLW